MKIKKEKKKQRRLLGKKGEGYVDTGVKILIAVVLGALVLSLLYTLFNTTIMPSVKSKVESMFSYSGGNIGGSGNQIEAEEENPDYTAELVVEKSSETAYFFAFTSKGESINELWIDGSKVSGASYITLQDNGSQVCVDGKYINALEKGTHTLKLIFSDGTATTEFNN